MHSHNLYFQSILDKHGIAAFFNPDMLHTCEHLLTHFGQFIAYYVIQSALIKNSFAMIVILPYLFIAQAQIISAILCHLIILTLYLIMPRQYLL